MIFNEAIKAKRIAGERSCRNHPIKDKWIAGGVRETSFILT